MLHLKEVKAIQVATSEWLKERPLTKLIDQDKADHLPGYLLDETEEAAREADRLSDPENNKEALELMDVFVILFSLLEVQLQEVIWSEIATNPVALNGAGAHSDFYERLFEMASRTSEERAVIELISLIISRLRHINHLDTLAQLNRKLWIKNVANRPAQYYSVLGENGRKLDLYEVRAKFNHVEAALRFLRKTFGEPLPAWAHEPFAELIVGFEASQFSMMRLEFEVEQFKQVLQNLVSNPQDILKVGGPLPERLILKRAFQHGLLDSTGQQLSQPALERVLTQVMKGQLIESKPTAVDGEQYRGPRQLHIPEWIKQGEVVRKFVTDPRAVENSTEALQQKKEFWGKYPPRAAIFATASVRKIIDMYRQVNGLEFPEGVEGAQVWQALLEQEVKNVDGAFEGCIRIGEWHGVPVYAYFADGERDSADPVEEARNKRHSTEWYWRQQFSDPEYQNVFIFSLDSIGKAGGQKFSKPSRTAPTEVMAAFDRWQEAKYRASFSGEAGAYEDKNEDKQVVMAWLKEYVIELFGETRQLFHETGLSLIDLATKKESEKVLALELAFASEVELNQKLELILDKLEMMTAGAGVFNYLVDYSPETLTAWLLDQADQAYYQALVDSFPEGPTRERYLQFAIISQIQGAPWSLAEQTTQEAAWSRQLESPPSRSGVAEDVLEYFEESSMEVVA
jgi:hypothetical protein